MMMDFKHMIKLYQMHITGVLHVGASHGQEAAVYDEVVKGPVIWVEAIPEVFEKLKRNIARYPKQQAINACVGDNHGRKVVFNVSNNEAQSSSVLEMLEHKTCHPEVDYVDAFMTVEQRLDMLLNKGMMDNVNFANFDIQGYELQALRGLGHFLDGIDYIWSEVNKKEVYKGCAMVWELDDFLRIHGFDRVATGRWVGDAWSDALYIRGRSVYREVQI